MLFAPLRHPSKFFLNISRGTTLAHLRALGKIIILFLFTGVSALVGRNDSLSAGFRAPPPESRPWVIWMWLSGNVTKEGITTDLEAMQRVGIGGALIMDVDQNTPEGPMQYLDERWLAMFHFAIGEAKRLGLELNVNNGPGYYGSGGAWIPPEQGMQTLVASRTEIHGGKRFAGTLVRPRVSTDEPPRQPWWTQVEPRRRFEPGADYRDVAVLAMPSKAEGADNLISTARLAASDSKDLTWKLQTLTWDGWVSYAGLQKDLAPFAMGHSALGKKPEAVIDLTAKMSRDGMLTWDAPAGDWTIWRIGHAFNGSMIGPTPDSTTGPETDKLSSGATALHLKTLFSRLCESLSAEDRNAWTTVHVDSWEGGGQNWTPKMREEFSRRRGYDPVPFLPAVFGQKVGDEEISQRFLWDLRKTVSELMVANYVSEIQRLCHAEGFKFSFESYTTIGNDLDASNFVDEPIAEFWPYRPDDGFRSTLKAMASAAHLNGHAIVGAESFDADEKERWLDHPAKLKPFADELFTMGVNKILVHRYAMQPFVDRRPGLQMGPWGQQYERTQTWWEYSKPWHTYLARCQYLLRQGSSVSDVLVLQSEEPLHRFVQSNIPGFDSDACSPDAFAHVSIKAGQWVAKSGLTYRLLVLDHHGCITTRLLEKVAERVRAGGAMLGAPPSAEPPGLGATDEEKALRRRLIAELWGEAGEITRKVGRGTVFRGIEPAAALAKLGVEPDFVSNAPIRWIHRSSDEAEIYFIANTSDAPVTFRADFRVEGTEEPQWWDAETGEASRLSAMPESKKGYTAVEGSLARESSAFVVFPRKTSLLAREKQAEKSSIQRFTLGHTPLVRKILDDPWTIEFPAPHQNGSTASVIVNASHLQSWHQSENSGVKYFSGTAFYTTEFNLASEPREKVRNVILDLGEVQALAEVELNGKNLGICWRPPFRLDVTGAVRRGKNQLQIKVTNLWVNRLIGDEQLPEDSERNADGTLKVWPKWLLENRPSPAGRETFTSWRLWKKGEPLQPSGLLGPVALEFRESPSDSAQLNWGR